MLEAMKITGKTYNVYLALALPEHKALALINKHYLVREKGQPANTCMIFDDHEFYARYSWGSKSYETVGFQDILVKPVDENDFPIEAYLPGNLNQPRG